MFKKHAGRLTRRAAHQFPVEATPTKRLSREPLLHFSRSAVLFAVFGYNDRHCVERRGGLDLFHFDLDPHRVGECVVDGGFADQLLNRRFVHVALDLELHANFAVA
jgi:hypothetical protein